MALSKSAESELKTEGYSQSNAMVVQRHREIMETADGKACFKINLQMKAALKALSLLAAGGKGGARYWSKSAMACLT